LKVDHIDADQDASGALAGFMINANQIGKAMADISSPGGAHCQATH
jgi:hypothetical protein